MKALVYSRNEVKYAFSKAVASVSADKAFRFGPLDLKEMDSFEPPSPDWVKLKPRLSGICGSDLSTLAGHTSRYFEPLSSFPFVMGHEIVADTETGQRVVIDAVLNHQARGCAAPHKNATLDYGYLTTGQIAPGIQTGTCEDTGGGWSEELIAHKSQLHKVPKALSDEAAVMVEPAASAIHAVMKAAPPNSQPVTAVVIGAGPIGLAAIAGLRKYTQIPEIFSSARHPAQQSRAKELGAKESASPDQLARILRKHLGCQMIGSYLSSGADIVIDAVGSSESLKQAMRLVRPQGRLVLCGMPGSARIDLAPLWHREVEMVGAYAYGLEESLASPLHTFKLAFDLVKEADLQALVSCTYALDDYKDAIAHAQQAGARGDSKIAFDLRSST